MAFPVSAVVRRHMEPTGRFLREVPSDVLATLNLPPGEAVLGFYRNPTPWESSLVLFTDRALYSVDGCTSFRIDIEDILGYESPRSKTDISGVRVRTTDGFRFVRVAGSNGPSGKYKDAFSFIMVVLALARARK